LGLEELESVNDDNFKIGRNYPFNVNKNKKTEKSLTALRSYI